MAPDTDGGVVPPWVWSRMLFLLLLGVVAGLAVGAGAVIATKTVYAEIGFWWLMVISGGLTMGALFIGWIAMVGVLKAKAKAAADVLKQHPGGYGQQDQYQVPSGVPYGQNQQPIVQQMDDTIRR